MKNNNMVGLKIQELLDANPEEFHKKLEESFGKLESLYLGKNESKFTEDLVSKINNYWTMLNYLKIPSTSDYKDIQGLVVKSIHILNLLKNYIEEKDDDIDIQGVLQPVGDDLGIKEDILYHCEEKEDNFIIKLENII